MNELRAWLRKHAKILLLAFVLLLHFGSLTPRLTDADDNAVYVMLAQSLATGQGYTNLWSEPPTPHRIFPFVFPALMAPLVWAFGVSIPVLKLVPTISGVAALWMLYILLRQYASERTALLIVLLTAANPHVMSLSNQLMAEAPCMFFTFLALYVLQRYGKDPRLASWLLPAAALAILLAFFTRAAQLTLYPTAGLFLLAHRPSGSNLKTRFAKAVVLCVIITLPYLWWKKSVVGEGGIYTRHFMAADVSDDSQGSAGLKEFARRVATNVYGNTASFPQVLVPQYESIFNREARVLNLLVGLPFAVIGGLACLWYLIRRRDAIAIYLIVYLGVLAIWRSYGFRYLAPIYPLLLLYLLRGVKGLLLVRLPLTRPKALLAWRIVLVLLIASSLAAGVDRMIGERTGKAYPPKLADYFKAADWIKVNAAEDAVILCRKPSLFRLVSGRRSYHYAYTNDHQEMLEAMAKAGADYVIRDQISRFETDVYLAPMLEANQDRFEQKAAINDTIIYAVKK